MSDTSRESINDVQRRMLLERTLGGPGQLAAYWSNFATEFFKGISQNMMSGWPAIPCLPSLQQLATPGVDVIEEGGNLVVTIEVPGFAKEDIQARILDNVLYVSAKRAKPVEAEKVHFTSIPATFSRAVWLPVPVEGGAKIKAKYEDGILRIRVPIKATSTVTIE